MKTINITALRHSAFYTPLLLTINNGSLEKHGLKAHYQPASAKQSINDLLINGDCHISQSAVAVSFAGLEKKQTNTLSHFAQINQKDGFYLSARKPMEQFQWSDLEGADVLVDHLFQPLATFRYVLNKYQIDIDKVNIIDAGDTDAIDLAFRQGQGDFVHQQGPAPQQLEADGVAHIVANMGDAVGPLAFSSLCAHKPWLNSDMAHAFMQAYQQSCNELQQMNSAEIADIIAPFFKDTPSSVLKTTLTHYQQLGCWSADPYISQASYQHLLDVFEFNQLVSQRYPYEQVISRIIT